MLGKANGLKFAKLENYFSAYSGGDSIHLHLDAWTSNNPDAVILDIQYRTYNATDADGNVSWGETALIIYKEDKPNGN